MRVSIFTPSHDVRFLQQAYDSIRRQDFHEWIILLNGKAKKDGLNIFRGVDPRIRIVEAPSGIPPYVGALKHLAYSQATGDILLELDHDDTRYTH